MATPRSSRALEYRARCVHCPSFFLPSGTASYRGQYQLLKCRGAAGACSAQRLSFNFIRPLPLPPHQKCNTLSRYYLDPAAPSHHSIKLCIDPFVFSASSHRGPQQRPQMLQARAQAHIRTRRRQLRPESGGDKEHGAAVQARRSVRPRC